MSACKLKFIVIEPGIGIDRNGLPVLISDKDKLL
jgi:hypothetical protein